MVSPLKTDLAGPRIDKGLDDIYVKETSICFVDGQRGRLLYRGYDIRDLAAQSTFEETVFLLLEGHLPNREELEKAKPTSPRRAPSRRPSCGCSVRCRSTLRRWTSSEPPFRSCTASIRNAT